MFWLYHSYLLFHTIKCRAYQTPHPTISITAVCARYNTVPLSSLNNPLNRACLSRPGTPPIHSATQSLCRRQTAISGLFTRFSLYKIWTGWKSERLTGNLPATWQIRLFHLYVHIRYVPRMAGSSRQTGTGRDYQRGKRPVAVQVPGTGHIRALGESSLTGGQWYAYGRITESRERRKEK